MLRDFGYSTTKRSVQIITPIHDKLSNLRPSNNKNVEGEKILVCKLWSCAIIEFRMNEMWICNYPSFPWRQHWNLVWQSCPFSAGGTSLWMSFRRISTLLGPRTSHTPPVEYTFIHFMVTAWLYIYYLCVFVLLLLLSPCHSFTWDIASRLAHILNTTSPSAGDSLNSKSLIVYATRYVDIGTVTSNLSSTQSVLFILNIGWRSRMCKNYINFALKGYKWMNDKYVHWFGGDFWHITQSRKIFVVT